MLNKTRKTLPVHLLTYSLAKDAALGIAVVSLLIGYYQLRHAMWRMVADGPLLWVTLGALALVSLAFVRVRYSSFPTSFSVLHRGVSIALLLFLILEPVDVTAVNPGMYPLVQQIYVGYVIAILFAVISLFRPSATLYTAFFLYLVHATGTALSGFPSHRLASVSLVETAQFLSISVLVMVLVVQWNHCKLVKSSLRVNLPALGLCLMFIGISLHLSHYFWSGYQKLRIGEQFWSWALNNHSQNLVLSSLYRGTLPSAGFPELTQSLFEWVSILMPWLNTGALLVQLLVIVAVLHVFALRVFSIAFDAMHIGIYLVTGLLLWPWIANNLAILFALKHVGRGQLSWVCRICCIVTIALGGFQHFGNASRLGWWDLRDITGTIIQAQDSQGTWHDLPLSYFNSHAQIVSMLIGQVQLPGHYSPTGWGGYGEFDRARSKGECLVPVASAINETRIERAERIEKVESFIRAHHQKLLGREQRYASAHPYPSLRYLSSSAVLPTQFKQVRDIQAYRLAMQSVCLDLEQGLLKTQVIAEDVFDIPLSR